MVLAVSWRLQCRMWAGTSTAQVTEAKRKLGLLGHTAKRSRGEGTDGGQGAEQDWRCGVSGNQCGPVCLLVGVGRGRRPPGVQPASRGGVWEEGWARAVDRESGVFLLTREG